VRVAVVRLPHLANPADLDPLVLEPAVRLRWATGPADVSDADLVILPGSRATVADLGWLRATGLDRALTGLAADPHGPYLLGICAGYQMLGAQIHDELESGAGSVPGLGLLPVTTTFEAPKVVRRVRGAVAGRPAVAAEGYEIRWGRPRPTAGTDGAGARPWLDLEGEAEGCVRQDGRVRGTSVHGVLDPDLLRHSLLGAVALVRGRAFTPSEVPYRQALDSHVDHLADWVEASLDIPAMLALARTAAPAGREPGWGPPPCGWSSTTRCCSSTSLRDGWD
jgi:adenosylcobyric acid synthase